MTTKINGDELDRKKFEKWGKSHRCDLDKWLRGCKAGQYKNPVVARMWQAWQAALSSKHEKA